MFKKCNSRKDQTLGWYDQCEDLKSREILENVLCLFYKGSCASVGLHFKINHFYFTCDVFHSLRKKHLHFLHSPVYKAKCYI